MQRTTSRRKASTGPSNALTLTPKLVSLAKEIVSIYDRINWEEFYKEDCDTVELIFQSVDDTRTAIKIMLGMAADNIALRNRMITKIQKALGRRSPAEASGATRVGGSVRKLDRAAEKLIEDLKAARKPSRFAFLCQQAWELSIKIDRSNRRKRSAGAMAPPIPQGAVRGIPGWLGPAGAKWIMVPARLAFAEPIVNLCQRITWVNIEVTTLHFEPREKDSLRLHHRLWTKCKPLSYRVPLGENPNPLCHLLQESIDVFLPKVMEMVSAFIDQIATVKAKTMEKPLPTATTPASQTEELVPIVITGNYLVQTYLKNKLELESVRTAVLGNALRGIAALTESDKTEVFVKHQEFVELTYRSDKNVRKKMDEMRKQLKGIGIKCDQPRGQGETRFSNYKVVFKESLEGQKLSPQGLKEWLARQPARTRAKPKDKE